MVKTLTHVRKFKNRFDSRSEVLDFCSCRALNLLKRACDSFSDVLHWRFCFVDLDDSSEAVHDCGACDEASDADEGVAS